MKYIRTKLLITIISTVMLVLAISPASAQSYTTYVVQEGDSLSKIALQFCTSWTQIYEINKQAIGDDFNVLFSGTLLTIPNDCGTGGSSSGSSGSSGSAGVGIYDRGATTYAAGSIVNGNIYVVAWGDTVFSIAQRFGLSNDDIWYSNEGTSNFGLRAGTRILIPGLNGLGTSSTPPENVQVPTLSCTLTSSTGTFEAYHNPGDGEVATLIDSSSMTGEQKQVSGGLTWYQVTYIETQLWIANVEYISTSGNC